MPFCVARMRRGVSNLAGRREREERERARATEEENERERDVEEGGRQVEVIQKKENKEERELFKQFTEFYNTTLLQSDENLCEIS